MKKLLVLIALFVFAVASSQDYTVLHINSSWNIRNDYKDLYKLEGARIVKAFLEDQQPSIRQQIKSVPVILIYKDNNVIGRWDADLTLSIQIPVSEIQEFINNSKTIYRRQTTD